MVIYQDQQDFNKEIRNIRRDQIRNEYLQKFVESIVKPLGSNRPAEDRVYQGARSVSHTLRVFLRKSDALGGVSMSGQFQNYTHTPWGTDETWTGERCPAAEAACVQHPM
jgi:hypothetical protein